MKNNIFEEKMESPVSTSNITSEYGTNRGDHNHHGVDLGVPSGTPIKSPLDGVIISGDKMSTGYHDNACGGTIKISHGNGIHTRYCHVKKIEKSENGTPVKKGEIIGYTGGGKNDPYKGSSTGPHLHFEMKKNGKLVNPMDYISKDVNVKYTEDDYKKDGFNVNDFKTTIDDYISGIKDISSDSESDETLAVKTLFGSLKKIASEQLNYHIENKIPLHENIFRIESENYFNLINEVRDLYVNDTINLTEDEKILVSTDIGKKVKTSIGEVNLDCPFILDEAEYKGREVNLNKPFRTSGGPKKFGVYVMNPKTNKVKLVRFGDSGLSIKAHNPEKAKSFLKRHKCDTKKDRTTPGWWSCNIHLYKKQLGLKFKGKW